MTVHIRIGTCASNFYRTACGLDTTDVWVTSYESKHLVTCDDCLGVFTKKKKQYGKGEEQD